MGALPFIPNVNLIFVFVKYDSYILHNINGNSGDKKSSNHPTTAPFISLESPIKHLHLEVI